MTFTEFSDKIVDEKSKEIEAALDETLKNEKDCCTFQLNWKSIEKNGIYARIKNKIHAKFHYAEWSEVHFQEKNDTKIIVTVIRNIE